FLFLISRIYSHANPELFNTLNSDIPSIIDARACNCGCLYSFARCGDDFYDIRFHFDTEHSHGDIDTTARRMLEVMKCLPLVGIQVLSLTVIRLQDRNFVVLLAEMFPREIPIMSDEGSRALILSFPALRTLVIGTAILSTEDMFEIFYRSLSVRSERGVGIRVIKFGR
ncbi:hypothetical protein AAF712_005823, partial [Marasmius tenuissimus]